MDINSWDKFFIFEDLMNTSGHILIIKNAGKYLDDFVKALKLTMKEFVILGKGMYNLDFTKVSVHKSRKFYEVVKRQPKKINFNLYHTSMFYLWVVKHDLYINYHISHIVADGRYILLFLSRWIEHINGDKSICKLPLKMDSDKNHLSNDGKFLDKLFGNLLSTATLTHFIFNSPIDPFNMLFCKKSMKPNGLMKVHEEHMCSLTQNFKCGTNYIMFSLYILYLVKTFNKDSMKVCIMYNLMNHNKNLINPGNYIRMLWGDLETKRIKSEGLAYCIQRLKTIVKDRKTTCIPHNDKLLDVWFNTWKIPNTLKIKGNNHKVYLDMKAFEKHYKGLQLYYLKHTFMTIGLDKNGNHQGLASKYSINQQRVKNILNKYV